MTKLLSGKVMVLAALALLLLAAMSAVAVAQARAQRRVPCCLSLPPMPAFRHGRSWGGLPGRVRLPPCRLGTVGYQRVGAGLNSVRAGGDWDASYVRHGLGLAAAGVEAHGITVYDELGNPHRADRRARRPRRSRLRSWAGRTWEPG